MATMVMNEEQTSEEMGKPNGRDAELAPRLPSLPDQITKDLVQLFKLLSDETRLRILHYLMQTEELHVRALCELLDQSQPAVSHHLALLRVAGLIESRRDGKHNFYRLLPERFHQFVEMVFSVSPEQASRFRFEDWGLSYTPDAR
jgi:ArsR family transcriptional regulator